MGDTHFDPQGAAFYATTQLILSRPTPDSPLSLISEWNEPENRGRLEFAAVELVDPTPEELQEYAGAYVSDELAATYRLAVRDSQLWLRISSRRWEQLDATLRDHFIPHLREPADGRSFAFERSENGEVTGLATDYYRVKGVRFAKR